MPDFKGCLTSWDETRKVCNDWRDDGYERCDVWGQDCVSWAKECVVSWIPIIGPAICKVFEWVCRGFQAVCRFAVWVSNMVCHAWGVLTVTICLTWEAVSPLLSLLGVFLKLILSIPILGAILRQFINAVTALVIGGIGFVVEGGLCGLLGICLPKKLRVCIIITNDGQSKVATEAQIQPMVDRMVQIYRDQARIHVFAHFDGRAATPNVRPKCKGDGWLQDLGLPGSQYENSASLNCREQSFASVVGLRSPIYAFGVRDIEGSSNGCSLGPLSNYVTFEVGANCTSLIAHEVGHACSLYGHSDSTNNLMYKDCVTPGRDQLNEVQKALVRGSKYVTYF